MIAAAAVGQAMFRNKNVLYHRARVRRDRALANFDENPTKIFESHCEDTKWFLENKKLYLYDAKTFFLSNNINFAKIRACIKKIFSYKDRITQKNYKNFNKILLFFTIYLSFWLS